MIPFDPDLPRPLIVLRHGTVFEDHGRGLEPVRVLLPGRARSAVIRAPKSESKSRAAQLSTFRRRMTWVQANLFVAVLIVALTGFIAALLILGGRY